MKHPVLIKKDYTIYFQYFEDYIIVHCDVSRWSKTVANRLLVDSFYLFSLQEKAVIVLHDESDKKHLKFIKLMGFLSCDSEVETEYGIRQVYQWKGI